MGVNTVFTEPIYKVMIKIKDKLFCKWPKAMPSDPSRRDPDKYGSYHKDHGHMTEMYKSLKLFLEDLVSKGHIPDDVIHGVLDLASLTKYTIQHSF